MRICLGFFSVVVFKGKEYVQIIYHCFLLLNFASDLTLSLYIQVAIGVTSHAQHEHKATVIWQLNQI